jgi:hypothetical protein
MRAAEAHRPANRRGGPGSRIKGELHLLQRFDPLVQ